MPRMRAAAWILVVLAVVTRPIAAGAKSATQPVPPSVNAAQFHPELQVFRAPGQIKIDGDLSDSGWVGAQPAMNFSEHSPGEEVEPPVRTKAFVTFDEDHLYLAAICYAEKGSVRASICEREQIFDDDNIGFFFDTYGDASRAYIINLNPYGIPYDALWTPTQGEDGNFDLLFESKGKVTDSGYQVEAAIPFRSLRFPNKDVQDWHFDFYRHHLREVHYSMSWARYDQNESCWPCRWGTVKGIEGVRPGKGLELLGSVVSTQSGAAEDGQDPQSTFENGDVVTEAGVGVRYAPTSDIALEGTANPDFSQIEADASQVDVNTTFALSYPEKRPFFQEGIDALLTNFFLVYTRSINDPDFAAKGSAKLGATSISVLSAHDLHSPMIVPFEERSEFVAQGKSFTNMMALRQAFGEDNHLRVVATDRRFEGGGSGSLASLDGALRLAPSLQWRAQAVYTYTQEPDRPDLTAHFTDPYFDNGKHTTAFDGEAFSGSALLTGLNYNSRRLFFDLSLYQRTPTYRADNGYQPRNNDRHVQGNASYLFRPNGKVFTQIQPHMEFARIYNFDGVRKDEWLYGGAYAAFPVAQAELAAGLMVSQEQLGGILFDNIWQSDLEFSLRPTKVLSLGVEYAYGRTIARNYLAMGYETGVQGTVGFRPVSRLQAEWTIHYSESHGVESGEEFFRGYISRLRLSYQFTRRFSLRLVTEYNDFDKNWGIDPLLTYRINAFSAFYVGATSDYMRFEDLSAPGTPTVTALSARQFFVKLQYLFMT